MAIKYKYYICLRLLTLVSVRLDTDFILQSEKKRGTMIKLYDKVQHSVLLSSRRTPSCNSVSFLFLITGRPSPADAR